MKVLLDTNILLQAISHKNRLRPIWTAFLDEKYDLIVSTPILLEYEEKIAEKTSQHVAMNVVSLISEAVNAILVTVYYQWYIISVDPDDNKFCDTAIAGNADYIVTDDSHFNEAKKVSFPLINILSASDFLNIIQAMK